jgi:16S rRNA (guanine527-N7)-methyltransferase
MNKKLHLYKQLITKYHRTLDLVSDVALEQFDQKIAESLVYADVVKQNLALGGTILDVGSGAGLPGVVLAIALPHYSFVLVERRQKRATFLKLVVSQLELVNVTVYLADVTDLKGFAADVVTALAVGSFKLIYCLTRQLHNKEIVLVSRKGGAYQAELEELESSLGVLPEIVANQPLIFQTLANQSNVSRETIYGNLIAVRLLGGLECVGS